MIGDPGVGVEGGPALIFLVLVPGWLADLGRLGPHAFRQLRSGSRHRASHSLFLRCEVASPTGRMPSSTVVLLLLLLLLLEPGGAAGVC